MPGNIEVAPFFSYPKMVDIDLQKQAGELHQSTVQVLQLILSLIGNNNCQTPAILTYPHRERGKSKEKTSGDMIELYDKTLKHGIGIYGDAKGNFTFSILDNSGQTDSVHGEKPKVASTGKKLGDAIIAKQSFSEFLKAINSFGASLDGPHDREPYIVMTKPHSPSIGRSSEGDILGLIFKPTAGHGTRSVHGKVQFLVRERAK